MRRRVCRRTGGTTGPEPVEGTELALEMLERVLELGYLKAQWVAGDDASGVKGAEIMGHRGGVIMYHCRDDGRQ